MSREVIGGRFEAAGMAIPLPEAIRAGGLVVVSARKAVGSCCVDAYV